MVKFVLANSKSDPKEVCIGLVEKNMEYLKAGRPISIKLSEFLRGQLEMEKFGPADDLFIFYGKDENAILEDLKKRFDFSRAEFRDYRTDH